MKTRILTPELMDDPDLDPVKHRQALAGLARLNAWSGGAGLLWKELRRLASQAGRPLRVLDVATGSGDVPIQLAKRAKHAGIPMHFTGCDVSDTALSAARQNALQAGVELQVFQHDVFHTALPSGFDVILASLFLHHLTDEQAVALLQDMGRATQQAIIVSDLVRSRLNLVVVTVASRLLSRSPIVHFDGPASVRAAYTSAEARGLAKRAGLSDSTVAVHFPTRWLLTWRKNQA
jgi:2-polyprenyl-3-methyl-5-hydroxy-6-metoxy-1,4-benzoquinol methylase